MSRRDRYRLDFRALMTQCEENYARMLPLMKAMGERDSMSVDVGHAHHTHTLKLKVLERSPYTTTVRLEDQELLAVLPASRLTVRLYHDARLAEVTEARPFRRVNARYGYPNRHMHQRDEKPSGTVFWRNGSAMSTIMAAIPATTGAAASLAIANPALPENQARESGPHHLCGELVTNSGSWTGFLEKCHHLGYNGWGAYWGRYQINGNKIKRSRERGF